ncbi:MULTISPECIES: cyclomaltodextrinase N-terminal domain-containing protein [unclassified Polaribacter]|uniref:cyclomaltodextrinase N-terminal domain-containing protein n=1 Tax=unclassified Polaribacter TaxID=196858 RepID=UPI00293918DC|nr:MULTISPECIES: cyclomaltodextrinase N-terminal domain-containing protein [unclassified Polaribacter]
MKKIVLVLLITVFISCTNEDKSSDGIKVETTISNSSLERVEPPNWFIGFQDTSLQLLVKEENIGNSKPSISYAGVAIEKVHKAKSKNYLFIDLKIDETTKAGKFDITFIANDGSKKTHTYELKSREKSADAYVGFDSADAIYLITPDRFSNGD